MFRRQVANVVEDGELSARSAKVDQGIAAVGAVATAMMLEDGYLDEWPFQMTRKGHNWLLQHRYRNKNGDIVYPDRYHARGFYF